WGPGGDRCEAEWFLAHILADAGRTAEAVLSLREGLALADNRGLDPFERVFFVGALALILLRHSGPDAVTEAAELMRASLAVCEKEIPQGRVRPWLRDFAMGVLGGALVAQQ